LAIIKTYDFNATASDASSA